MKESKITTTHKNNFTLLLFLKSWLDRLKVLEKVEVAEMKECRATLIKHRDILFISAIPCHRLVDNFNVDSNMTKIKYLCNTIIALIGLLKNRIIKEGNILHSRHDIWPLPPRLAHLFMLQKSEA